MTFEVALNEFEGPLDLMLHLISKEELDLFDLDITKLCDQYIEYVNAAVSIHLEVASEYLTMLATLMEYKSRRLLPSERVEIDDDYQEDPHSELVRRLLEYQQFKEASEMLQQRYLERLKQYSTPPSSIVEAIIADVNELPLVGSVNDLMRAMDRLLLRISLDNPFQSKIAHKELSVDERIITIKERFKNHTKPFSFSEILSDSNDLHVFVVSFLSILDLIRLNLMNFIIDDDSEIWLRWSEISE